MGTEAATMAKVIEVMTEVPQVDEVPNAVAIYNGRQFDKEGLQELLAGLMVRIARKRASHTMARPAAVAMVYAANAADGLRGATRKPGAETIKAGFKAEPKIGLMDVEAELEALKMESGFIEFDKDDTTNLQHAAAAAEARVLESIGDADEVADGGTPKAAGKSGKAEG